MKNISTVFLLMVLCGASPVAQAVEVQPDKMAQEAEKKKTKQEILDELKRKMKTRVAEDARYYSKEERIEIEKLYHSWQSKRGKEQQAVAITMQRRFPKANRTGCAMLYLAQDSPRGRQMTLLRQVIRDNGTCMYGNGVQVGALARYYLVIMLKQDNKGEESQKLLDEMNELYPNAIDHQGEFLADLIAINPLFVEP